MPAPWESPINPATGQPWPKARHAPAALEPPADALFELRPDFDGATYERERDADRLHGQLSRVREALADGQWHTLAELAHTVQGSEAGVSARLRDLRKVKFGGHLVDRRYVADGLWEYRLVKGAR